MIESIMTGGKYVDQAHMECIGKQVSPCKYTPVTYKAGRMIESLYIRTETGPYTLQITLYIEATNADDLRSLVYTFSHLHHAEIQFVGDDKLYRCIQTSAKPQILSGRNALLDLEFDAEIFSARETAIMLAKNPQTILIDGARETYINFEVTAKVALTNYMINDIKIKSLAVGSTLIINSTDRLVDMSKVDLLNFPQTVGMFSIAADVSRANVMVRYRARW